MQSRRLSILVGAIAFGAVLGLYLFLVVSATPVFSPRAAVLLAVGRNWHIMLVLALGVALQVSLITYRLKTRACSLRKTGSNLSIAASGPLVSGFASFFSLASIGCCSLFVFTMSTILGLGATTLLLQYSEWLTAFGFLLMAFSIILMLRSIKNR